MSSKLFINSRNKTHTIVFVEDGKILEFNKEDESNQTIVGNIYKGVVSSVIRGMQATFVDIGRNRNGYLAAKDTIVDIKGLNGNAETVLSQDFTKSNTILVQATKVETELKGARLTQNISLAGRYLVYMPLVDYVGISKKILSEENRETLESFVLANKQVGEGFIIRTNAEEARPAQILKDMKILQKRWNKVLEKYETAEEGTLIHEEADIITRALRDIVTKDTDEIVVDTKEAFDIVQKFKEEEELSFKATFFKNKTKDIFNSFGLGGQLSYILNRKVIMPSGAYLIIEQTEALTVIDVNTGRYVGSSSLEETVFETNLEAAKVIAAQLRLRKIGGIIIIDFIDMEDDAHKEATITALSHECKKDRVKTTVIGMTPLGLCEVTRTKSAETIRQKFSSPCPYCDGRGYVVKYDILKSFIQSKIMKIFEDPNVSALLLTVARDVYDSFLETGAFSLEISLYWSDKRIYLSYDMQMMVQNYEIKKFTQNVIDLPDDAILMT